MKGFIGQHANEIMQYVNTVYRPSMLSAMNAIKPPRLGRHIQGFSLYESIRSPVSNPDNSALDLSGLEKESHWVVSFLSKFALSDNLDAQLWCLRNLDDDMRDILQGTVFSSEILIAYARIFYGSESPTRDGVSEPLEAQPMRGVETYLLEIAVILCYYFR